MKNFLSILILSLFLYPITSNASTPDPDPELELITATLMNYIEGTSYNHMNRVEEAFYPEANLYLDNKEKQLWVISITEYIGLYKDATPGKFNGRVGKIISIDYFNNIAQAKIEILLPAYNVRYIDMLILKKIEGEWKIISKTAGNEESNKQDKRILIVVSNAHFYGDSELNTGNSFSEIVFSYDVFDEAGYTVDFVSPEGGAIPLAYVNTADDLQKKYLYDQDFMYALKHTKAPAQIKPEKYQAVYYAGGGSAMFGVPENKAIQEIVMYIYEENQGVISSVCHGTAGIVNLKTKAGKYLVDGKIVNGYPDDYERHDAAYYQLFPFKITQTIEARGGIFKYGEKNAPHIEIQGNLITGQNHLSSKMVALEVIKNLEGRK